MADNNTTRINLEILQSIKNYILDFTNWYQNALKGYNYKTKVKTFNIYDKYNFPPEKYNRSILNQSYTFTIFELNSLKEPIDIFNRIFGEIFGQNDFSIQKIFLDKTKELIKNYFNILSKNIQSFYNIQTFISDIDVYVDNYLITSFAIYLNDYEITSITETGNVLNITQSGEINNSGISITGEAKIYKNIQEKRLNYSYYILIPNLFDDFSIPSDIIPYQIYDIKNLNNPNTIRDMFKYIMLYYIFFLIKKKLKEANPNEIIQTLAFFSSQVNNIFPKDYVQQEIAPKVENLADAMYQVSELQKIYPLFRDIANTIDRIIFGGRLQYLDDYSTIIVGNLEGINYVQDVIERIDTIFEKMPITFKTIPTTETITYYINDINQFNSYGNIINAINVSDLTNSNIGFKYTVSISRNYGNNGVIKENSSISNITATQIYSVIEPNTNVYLYDENGYKLYYILYNDGSTQIVNEKDLVNIINQNRDRIILYRPLKGKVDAQTFNQLYIPTTQIQLMKQTSIVQTGKILDLQINPYNVINLVKNNHMLNSININIRQGKGSYRISGKVSISYSLRERK